VSLVVARDFGEFRDAARQLLRAGVEPAEVEWTDGVQASLFGRAEPAVAAPAAAASTQAVGEGPRVPRELVREAEIAADHSDPRRFALLYRILWKLTHGQPAVLSNPLDGDVAELTRLVREVREEEHKMHAFVRFRRVENDGDEATETRVAWFRPAHPILRRVAPFFARRYPNMRWSLLTPEASAHWDGHELRFGEGAPREHAPAEDELDRLFLTYYSSVFNPARTNVQTMGRHMPKRILEQMPEGGRVRGLAHEAPARVTAMQALTAGNVSRSSALLPQVRDRAHLAAAAERCRACPIGENATQVVWGEGPAPAPLMMVGEQPGDEEDRAGHPFVGPAGRLLDQMLEKAGLDRTQTYVTNAVKHFKWEPRGKRRLHSKPNRDEIDACRGWLDAELALVEPKMILCLGATAAQAFAGAKFRVQRDRGKPMATPWAPWWMATYHPSALLRAPDEEARQRMEEEFLADLALARDHLRSLRAA
jgi:DNA polymerase